MDGAGLEGAGLVGAGLAGADLLGAGFAGPVLLGAGLAGPGLEPPGLPAAAVFWTFFAMEDTSIRSMALSCSAQGRVRV